MSLTTGDATIERLEDSHEMLMQAALRGRFRSQQVQHCQSLLQGMTVAVPQISSNRNRVRFTNMKRFRRPWRQGNLGSEERKTGSFGGLFHIRGLM